MDESKQSIYEFSETRLDSARRRLTRQGKPVAVFPRTFDALLLLVERRGELLEKDFLLQSLWPDAIVEENSLAKVISDVRRALGEGARSESSIATVPRRGYRFVGDVRVVHHDERPLATSAGDRREIHALAVLPFSILNLGAGDEFLSVGLADALITRLGQLRRTLLRPTSSIARFATGNVAPADAGAQLGVDTVISGSVRRVENTVRVSVQLVSVTDNTVTWAEKFDLGNTGALQLEDAIAERVADALTLALARREQPPAQRCYTENADAYEHYVRGRYLVTKRSRETMLEAIQCFERAISIDPRYALAHAGLGEAWVHMGLRAAVSQSIRPREAMPRARAAAEKALELDDSLSEAHSTLGQVLVTYEWNRTEGMHELTRAIELNPNNQSAQHWLAMAFAGHGRFDEALTQIHRALEIDPLAVIVNANLGYLLYRAGRYDEAIAKLRHTLAMEPTFVMTRYRLGLALEASGRFEEAIEQFEAMRPSIDGPLGLTAIARTRALMGQTDVARRILAELAEIGRNAYIPAATLADIHVALGEHERALDYLELCVEERAIVAMWLNSERHWDPLRANPRFPEIVHRVGL